MPPSKYLFIHDWRKHQSYRADRGMPPWLKIHRSLLRNSKWLSLSEIERCHLFSMWILAADDDGRIVNDAGIIRRACGLDSEPDLTRLLSLGLLDAKLTPPRRQVGVTVTTINALRDRPEAETETEKKEEPPAPTGLPPLESVNGVVVHDSSNKRGSRLPKDWRPDPIQRDYAARQGCNPDATAANFRDYWLATAGARGIKLDWDRVWQTWCRKDGNGGRPTKPAIDFAQIGRDVDERKRIRDAELENERRRID